MEQEREKLIQEVEELNGIVKERDDKIEELNEYITDLQDAINEIYSIAKKF